MSGKKTFNLVFDAVIDPLMKAAEAKTYKALADLLGINQQNISNAKTKGFIPMGWVLQVAEQKGISYENILKKKGSPTGKPSLGPAPERIGEIHVPYGYGGPAKVQENLSGIFLDIARDWLDKTFTQAQRPHLIGWVVEGDNLAPEIPVNTFVLIDTSQTNIMSSGIFAFQIENSLALRRLHLRLDGRIDVVNDNRAYPSMNMAPSEILSNQAMKVIGRVIFKGLKIA